jgi:hypothetical protein
MFSFELKAIMFEKAWEWFLSLRKVGKCKKQNFVEQIKCSNLPQFVR